MTFSAGNSEMKIREDSVIIISIDDRLYPERLKNLEEPPRLLYARGNADLLEADLFTVVTGTENVSMKGMDVAIGLSNILSARGHVIVSGMGKGSDTGAHLGCLGAGGRTIAVLNYPVTQVESSENRALADRILQNGGLLLSAWDDGDESVDDGETRGRIMAALGDGMIVIESFSSETVLMNTIRCAIDMDKAVGAYRHPGGFDMTETSEGNEYLIKECGVVPVRNIKDAEKLASAVEEKRRKK